MMSSRVHVNVHNNRVVNLKTNLYTASVSVESIFQYLDAFSNASTFNLKYNNSIHLE